MKLSEHFSFDELTNTSHSELIEANREEAKNFIEPLTITAAALEEIRIVLGNKAIHVSSGYRGATLNKAVGGSPTSAHSRGLAADIIPKGVSIKVAFATILKDKHLLKGVRKVIREEIGNSSWLHIQAKTKESEPLEFYTTTNGKNYTKV